MKLISYLIVRLIAHLYLIGLIMLFIGATILGGNGIIYGIQIIMNRTNSLELGLGFLYLGGSIVLTILVDLSIFVHYGKYTQQTNNEIEETMNDE